jgi:hypothetical protein
VPEKHRIHHMHAQCVNWIAVPGIRYPKSRACPLICSLLLGFPWCDKRETESDKNIIFWCSFIGYFFLRLHIWHQWTSCHIWLWYKRERIPDQSAIWLILSNRTNQLASCFDTRFSREKLPYTHLHDDVSGSLFLPTFDFIFKNYLIRYLSQWERVFCNKM